MSHHSNGALIASTKTYAREVAPQNYNKTTTMCWDGMLLHSPNSFSRRAFDYSQSIDQEGLLSCLLHLSLQVKSIMASAVSQMLHQKLNTFRGLNISDPHHLVATSHLKWLLSTSISPPHIFNFVGTFQLALFKKPWRNFKLPPFFIQQSM